MMRDFFFFLSRLLEQALDKTAEIKQEIGDKQCKRNNLFVCLFLFACLLACVCMSTLTLLSYTPTPEILSFRCRRVQYLFACYYHCFVVLSCSTACSATNED